MGLRNVVVEGDDVLRTKCKEVKEVNDRMRGILQDMLETMRSQMGVGIAAPQVGVLRRMFIAEPEPEKVFYMINPVILEASGSQVDDEGCLSVPGMIGTVERYDHIRMQALDLEGQLQEYEFDGFYARVMQHENDHLDGILYIDKAVNIREAVYDDEEYEDEE